MKTIDALKPTITTSAASFARGRAAQPSLEDFATPAEVLAALALSSSVSREARDAVTLALVAEHRRSGGPLWQSLLLVSYTYTKERNHMSKKSVRPSVNATKSNASSSKETHTMKSSTTRTKPTRKTANATTENTEQALNPVQTTPQPVQTTPPTNASTPPADVATQAQEASAAVTRIAAGLTFFDPSEKDMQAAHGGSRVPLAALNIAASILEANPGRFPDFSATDARAAVDYTTAMAPLAVQIDGLQQRLSKSVFNRHGQGAAETLALYQMLKGLARLPNGKGTLAQYKSLAKLMVTRKKVRATTVTQKDLKGAAKTLKLSKVTKAKAVQAAVVNAEAQLAATTEAVTVAGAAAIASASQAQPSSSQAVAATPAAATVPTVVTPGH